MLAVGTEKEFGDNIVKRHPWEYARDGAWPVVNGVTVKYGCDKDGYEGKTENPNFVLYVQRDGKWYVWDRVWASSEEAATAYFDATYRKEICKVLPC